MAEKLEESLARRLAVRPGAGGTLASNVGPRWPYPEAAYWAGIVAYGAALLASGWFFLVLVGWGVTGLACLALLALLAGLLAAKAFQAWWRKNTRRQGFSNTALVREILGAAYQRPGHRTLFLPERACDVALIPDLGDPVAHLEPWLERVPLKSISGMLERGDIQVPHLEIQGEPGNAIATRWLPLGWDAQTGPERDAITRKEDRMIERFLAPHGLGRAALRAAALRAGLPVP